MRRALGLRPAPAWGPEVTRVERDTRVLWAFVAVCVTAALALTATRAQANPVLAGMAGLLVVAAWKRHLLAWPTLIGYVLIVILFIPIRRYTMGAGLPIGMEPYRALIGVVLLAWFFALLADPATRWRRMGLEGPAVGLTVAWLISIAFNLEWIMEEGIAEPVIKQVSFFASFLLVMYFVGSVVTSRRQIDRLMMVTVVGATLVAGASIVEWRAGYNPFHHVEQVLPFVQPDQAAIAAEQEEALVRGVRRRASASAQHPIALGAALVLLVPLAIYLWRRRDNLFWLGCAGGLTLGAMATGSRTAVLMLVAELLVFFWIKRAETVRLLPLLLPLIVACHVMVPGSLGTFKAILFPEGGLIEEQRRGDGGTGSGRVADLGPSLEQYAERPFFGHGFGTRLPSQTDDSVNAKILDNEWLGVLIEVGAVGALLLLWLYVRAVRMLARAGKADPSAHGLLLACLAASITAFAAGMLTFDAFSFIQVTFLSFILLGLGAVALRLEPEDAPQSTSVR